MMRDERPSLWFDIGLIVAMIVAFVLLFTVTNPPKAHAHTRWANNEPVPEWVSLACCGPDDVHHLRDEQVHVVDGGYRVDGFKEILPEKSMLPSPDGEWWIFYRDFADGSQSHAYCFFGPLRGS